jgi:uncharacterized membrane protein
MERWIVIGVVFVLIAQAIGLVAYYLQRNQFSKSAQNIITVLPAIVFAVLAVAGGLLYILLAWWAEVEGLRGLVFDGQPPLWMRFGIYVFGGAIANIFLSIVVQLVVLMIHPPIYKSRRRRRRRKSSSTTVPDETTSVGS